MYIAKQLITPTESNQDQYKKEIDFSNLTRDILEVSEKFKEEALEEMVRKSEPI